MQATPRLRLVRNTNNDTQPQLETLSSAQQTKKDKIKRLLQECTSVEPTPGAIEERFQGIEQQLLNLLNAVQQKDLV